MAIRYGNSGMVQLTSPTIGEFWLNAYEIVSVCHRSPEWEDGPKSARTIIETTACRSDEDCWAVTESPDAVLERIHNAKTYRRMGGEP